jgi:uncharacterized membrane protein YdfJ with MMPL/SSD domain
MPISKCNTRNNKQYFINNEKAKKKNKGRALAQIERESKSLDAFETRQENCMQDRKKFMSAKNALRADARLKIIDQQKEALKAEAARVQESS